MKNNIILSILSPTQQEMLDYSVMFGVFFLVAVFTLWWVFRTPKKRKRKRRHYPNSTPPPNRAQVGGLPPIRGREDKPGLPPEA